MNNLRKQTGAAFLLIFICGMVFQVSAQTDKRIDAIREIYRETNEKIAESNENGEQSEVYLAEFVVNKNNGSYPAVGIFQTFVKFYYTYGMREKNPYPNRLLKIEIETKRSANVEKYEYLYDEKERLIFFFEEKDAIETRIYFTNEKPFKFLRGEKSANLNGQTENAFVKNAQNERKRLEAVFRNILE